MIGWAILLLGILCGEFALAIPSRPIQIRFFKIERDQKKEVSSRFPGDKTMIRVEGLLPETRYTLRSAVELNKKTYASFFSAFSNRTGIIETDSSLPVEGTYATADADGLFWSMKVIGAGENDSSAYLISLEQNGNILATRRLPLEILKPDITTVSLSGTGLVGTLYVPPRLTHPRPAIIAFGGSEGGTFAGRWFGATLANEGYVTLGLGYFHAPGLPSDLAKIPLEYFQSAISFLRSRPEVGSEKIGVIGVSRGGELALLLGATFPEIKAVVGLVPSPIRWPANVAHDAEGNPIPAWTFKGLALPFLSTLGGLVETLLPNGMVAYDNAPAFLNALKDPAAVERAMTPIENIQGPVLLQGGEDDRVWPSCIFVKMAMKRLAERNHAFPDEGQCYASAGHAATRIPGSPTTETAILHPVMNILMNMGGTPEANARSQRDSWSETLQFFRKHLGQ